MTHDHWTPADEELSAALRDLYAAPDDESYWSALEARITAAVAARDRESSWWSVLAEVAPQGLTAAAAVLLAATITLAYTSRVQARSASVSVLSGAAASAESVALAGSVGDGDLTLHHLLSP